MWTVLAYDAVVAVKFIVKISSAVTKVTSFC